MSEALRLAAVLEDEKMHSMAIDTEAAAELRRLHAENEALKVELHEQARVNGMGGEREASLMAELERKSDAIQRLWKERDELRSECRTLVRQNGEWQELNAGLVEALRRCRDMVGHPDNLAFIDAALAKVGANNGS